MKVGVSWSENEIRILDNYKNIKENIIRAIKHPLK
jgi:hypothetical protein